MKTKTKKKDADVTSTEDNGTRTTTIVTKHTLPDDEWHDKQKFADLERDSEAMWQKLDDEQRQALIIIVTDILKRMIEDPDVWIPTSMVARTGHKLDLWVGFNFDEIDEEVVRRRLEAERQLLETKHDLERLERELGPDAAKVLTEDPLAAALAALPDDTDDTTRTLVEAAFKAGAASTAV